MVCASRKTVLRSKHTACRIRRKQSGPDGYSSSRAVFGGPGFLAGREGSVYQEETRNIGAERSMRAGEKTKSPGRGIPRDVVYHGKHIRGPFLKQLRSLHDICCLGTFLALCDLELDHLPF